MSPSDGDLWSERERERERGRAAVREGMEGTEERSVGGGDQK